MARALKVNEARSTPKARGTCPRPSRALFVLGALLLPATAGADHLSPRVMVSVRYGFGFGGGLGDAPRGLRVEQVLRSEVLFGAPGDERFRLGPAADLRTNRLRSAEASAGLGLLLPVVRGYPLVLTATAGYAYRRGDRPDGPVFVGTAAMGYRSYNFHGRYAQGYQVYISARSHLRESRAWELTAGIEVDLEGMLVLPAAALLRLFRRGPPDEP